MSVMNDATAKNDTPCESSQERRRKRNARVCCAGGSEFWTTQHQFWEWAREGVVTYLGDNPLTGKFEGRRERLIVMVNHVLLDNAAPEHKSSVLHAYGYQKRARTRSGGRGGGRRS
jgi:hypothetical protein